jgi:hypothetical protein
MQSSLQGLVVLVGSVPSEPLACDAIQEAADTGLLVAGGRPQTLLEVGIEAPAVDFGSCTTL